jgi:HSP20 family protein
MSLIKEFNHLRQQMDKLFEDIVHEQPHLGILAKTGEMPWSPAIELQETERLNK